MGLNSQRLGFEFSTAVSCSGDSRDSSIFRRCKQRIKNINQLALVLGLLDEEDAVVSRENICLKPLQRALCSFTSSVQIIIDYAVLDAV